MNNNTALAPGWAKATPSLNPWSVIETTPDVGAAIARATLGAMILPHGLQKTFGWFGGFGFDGTMAFFTDGLGLPWLVSLLVVLTETAGGVALLVGLGGRIAALAVGAVMVGAAVTTHATIGFFMNWFGNLPAGAEGWEFHLIALGLVSVVAIKGSGALSVDRFITTAYNGRSR